METLEIAVIHRVENDWLVTVPNSSYSKDTYLCMTWEDVEKRTRLKDRIDAALAAREAEMIEHRKNFARDSKDFDRTMAAWKNG